MKLLIVIAVCGLFSSINAHSQDESQANSQADPQNCSIYSVDADHKGPQLKDDELITQSFIDGIVQLFRDGNKLQRIFICRILEEIEEVFKKEPTLVNIHVPENATITVVGDIHGQFEDLMTILTNKGQPSATNIYLFNGDYVDRGADGMECMLVLFAYKLAYPQYFFMNRGNHETQEINYIYGFQREVFKKYDETLYVHFNAIFNWLPLCHVINHRIFTVHGGLPATDNVTLNDIRNLKKNGTSFLYGTAADLLWADPQTENGRTWSLRGVSKVFGPDITEAFLQLNNLDYIIRSHEVADEGYEIQHNGKCITVFSAPNYSGYYNNKGAYVVIDGKELKMKFVQFEGKTYVMNEI